ncbi:MAG: hypothetical protein MUC63_05010, partial [Planctomycetes bacterium]|nr:hypothetical protein [Planctomycetota bacterium]
MAFAFPAHRALAFRRAGPPAWAAALLFALACPAPSRAADAAPEDPADSVRRSLDGLRSRFFADREAAVRSLIEIGRKDPSSG